MCRIALAHHRGASWTPKLTLRPQNHETLDWLSRSATITNKSFLTENDNSNKSPGSNSFKEKKDPLQET